MRGNKIVSVICICGLLLSGCGSDGVADKTDNTPQTENVQPTEDAQPTEKAQLTEDVQPTKNVQQDEDKKDDETSASEKITEKEALAKALSHAGVKESDLTTKRIKRETEDGKEVYDVEFYADGKEYDYEISIDDGSIVKSDFEIDDDSNRQGKAKSSKTKITEKKAKEIALAKVPGARQIHIKKDTEDGRIVYEGEVIYKNVEYEFEIDADTGKILNWEKDNA